MFRFFFIIFLLFALPDVYLWLTFTRQQPGVWRTALLFAPTVAACLCMALLLCQVRANLLIELAFILLICVAVPKLVFVVFDLLARLVGWGHPVWRQGGMRVALVLSVLIAAAQVYGTTFGWHRLKTARTEIKVKGLPQGFDGFRVVQISDLHLGTYAGDTAFVSRMVDSVNAARPDLIVFTGDIVNTTSDELPPYLGVLSRLHAPGGVFSILGNHDYCLYHPGLTPTEQAWHVRRIVRLQKQMGWEVLLNESRTLRRGTDSLVIAGVENTGRPPFPARGDLHHALRAAGGGTCTILLSHDPWHWRHGVVGQSPVSLTLSGHTHALQLQIGSFSPAQWFMPEWGGLYKSGNQQLFVSTGIGGTIPYRLGAWPKIEVITLRKG